MLHPALFLPPEDVPPRLELAQRLHREQRVSLGLLEQGLPEIRIELIAFGVDQPLAEITAF